ncbi:hypothetical protein AAFF_G00209860 [Aldrovandia affinis]|uniref:Immunoglobulin domain-containing protein n=1 Tax=Aldrovandia affinis TaxID=143900 RepID=A0AAD7SWE1_9TELE|nr:hypothetical protein AAFF_G00209860 [Aldrovandia affinis]
MTAPSYLCSLCILSYLTVAALSTIHREVTVTLCSSVDIQCSDKPWNMTISVIWSVVPRKGERCTIGSATGSRFVDTCQDGKTQRNTNGGVPYLHIPHIGFKDEGIYTCNAKFKKGSFRINTSISIKEKEENTVVTCYGTSSLEPYLPATSVAPLSTQMFCIKEVKSGT